MEEGAKRESRWKAKTLPEYAKDYLEGIDPETKQPRIVKHAQGWVEESLTTPALFIALLDRLYGKVPNAMTVQNDGQMRVVIVHEDMNAD